MWPKIKKLSSGDIFDKLKSNFNYPEKSWITTQFQTIWEVAQRSSSKSLEVTIKSDLFYVIWGIFIKNVKIFMILNVIFHKTFLA